MGPEVLQRRRLPVTVAGRTRGESRATFPASEHEGSDDSSPNRTRRPVGFAALVLVVAATVASTTSARTWRINVDGSGDAPTIQAGIDLSAEDDTVLVGPGTYDENLDMTSKNIVLRSKNGAAVTVVDAGRRGRVLEASGGVVEGFTLRNGLHEFLGGGVLVIGVKSTILRHNVIEENIAGLADDTGVGGGVYLGQDGAAILESNIIRDNIVTQEGGGIWDNGLYSEIRGNVITGNSARNFAGGIMAGLHTSIVDNVVASNFATYGGAGIYVSYDLPITISNNTIIGNRTSNGIPHGAGIDSSSYLATISNNIVVDNHSGGIGGRTGAGILSAGVTRCNDTWGNDVDEIGGPAEDRNFSRDPEFCGVDPLVYLNFTLQSDSPCAPGNDPFDGSCGLIGAAPAACGTVGAQSRTWSEIKKLFR